MSRDKAMLNAFDPAAADALPEAERALIARRQRVLGPSYRPVSYTHLTLPTNREV